MNNYKITISVPSDSPEDAKKLATLLQQTAAVVAYDDIVKLLSKVATNPGIVKTALKFI